MKKGDFLKIRHTYLKVVVLLLSVTTIGCLCVVYGLYSYDWRGSIHGFNRYAEDFQAMVDILVEHEEEISCDNPPWVTSEVVKNTGYLYIGKGSSIPLTTEEEEHVRKANEAYYFATKRYLYVIELKENEIWFGTEGRGYYVVYTKDGKRPDYSNDPGFDDKEVSVRKNSAHWYEVMARYR